MPLKDYLKRFFATHLGQIVGSNAADGIASGLHERQHVEEFLQAAYDGMGADDAAPFAEFMAQMRDLCFSTPGTRAKYLGACRHGRAYVFPDERFTLVLPLGVLNLASADDQQRFADSTGEIPGTPECVYQLPDAERYFRLDPTKKLGGETLWFTFKHVIDSVLLTTPSSGSPTSADVCRDTLGLIHRQPGPTNDLHLVALHVPSQVLRSNGHFRPTFMEANDHRRFSAKSRTSGVSNDDPWGRTIDLSPLAHEMVLQDGARERLTQPFRQSDITPDNVILFDPLGKVTIPRGNTQTDDDEAFAKAISDGRTTADLLAIID